MTAREDENLEPRGWRAYAVSLLVAGLALLLWRIGLHDIGPSPYPILLLAVMGASWYGGRGPGLLATVLSLGIAVVVYGRALDNHRDALQLALFLILSLAICWMNHERLKVLRRERDARERVERLAAERSAMLSQMTDAIITADTESRVTFMNGAAVNLLGIPSWRGLTMHDLAEVLRVTRVDGARHEPLLNRALAGDVVAGEELALQRPDGARLTVQVNATQIVAPDETVLGTVASVRDVTAERDLEQQKAAFVAGVAHDLKNPLTSIKGTAQLLLRRAARGSLGAALPPEVISGLQEIETGASMTVELIHRFLEAEHAPAGGAPESPKPVDLVSLVQRAARLHQHATDSHVILVREGRPRVVGSWDEGRLERIVGNLLSNAIKYSPDGGEIVVTIDQEGDGCDACALLTVSDRGVGIPASDRNRIFDEFQRGGNVREQIPGTGIGLAATKHLVQGYGGKIAVMSEEGRGTTFVVRLSMHPNARAASESAQ